MTKDISNQKSPSFIFLKIFYLICLPRIKLISTFQLNDISINIHWIVMNNKVEIIQNSHIISQKINKKQIMFKPSLRKSFLNDNLSLESHKKPNIFQKTQSLKESKLPQRVIVGMQEKQTVGVPSMMIPQRLLAKATFHLDQSSAINVFTPFTYAFKPYPRAVREFISPNPNKAQAGKIQNINFVIYEKCLFLWTDSHSNHKSIIHSSTQSNLLLKMHKFSEPIDMAQFSTISNPKIFTCPKAIVMAIVFKNRIKLFMINTKQLSLEDIMLKYQLKGAIKIQQIHYTEQNQLIFAGDNGKVSMISLNGTTSTIISVQQQNLIKKYLSKTAFDYSTVYSVREIISDGDFVYCLYDRIQKGNYLMYVLKSAVHKIVKLQNEPKHILNETFVDIYKFSNSQRKVIKLINRISQNGIQQKVKEGYSTFWGQGVKDGFKIVAVRTKKMLESSKSMRMTQMERTEMISQIKDEENIKGRDHVDEASNVLKLVTKCGYVIQVVVNVSKQSIDTQQTSSTNNSLPATSAGIHDNISFTSQPIKLPSLIGPSNLLSHVLLPTTHLEKTYRKNFVIKAVASNKPNEVVLVMNDCLMRISEEKELNVVMFQDLKVRVTQTTEQKDVYVTKQQFEKKYNTLTGKSKSPSDSPQRTFFSQPKNLTSTYDAANYRLFNRQRRFTSFDNEGRLDVYLLELRHIIMGYLSYFVLAKSTSTETQQISTLSILNGIQYQARLQKIMEKLIHAYGYCRIINSLLEILTINSHQDREYIHFQRTLLIDIIKKEFESQPSTLFEEWNYSLSQRQESQLIVVNDAMLHQVWLMLFQYHLKAPLGHQIINTFPFFEKIAHLDNSTWSDIRTTQKYTAYGNALQSQFHVQLQVLFKLRAKQFKVKQGELKNCEKKLIQLYWFIEQKNKKSLNYRQMIETKLVNRKKQQQQHSLSTSTVNTSGEQTTYGTYEEQFQSKAGSYVNQSNCILQTSISGSIQKIITMVDVMNVLIQKDEREGVPTILQVLTSYISQLKCGELLFNEELHVSQQNAVTFLHPELVQRVLKSLPELQLDKKIQFLKFKIARNLLCTTQPSSSIQQQNDHHMDLKSLDLRRLSKLVSSTNLAELRRMFLAPEDKQFSPKDAQCYTQFLVICLTNLISNTNQMINIKQAKFNDLSDQMKKDSLQKLPYLKLRDLTRNYNVQKILLSEQRLQYYQSEMKHFYEELIYVFKSTVNYLCKVTGPRYYQTEKFLERIIETLVLNFPNEQILIQTIKIVLKDANMIDKVQFVRLRRRKMENQNGLQRIFMDLGKQIQTPLTQRSTFEYLLNKGGKGLNQDRTIDTWRNLQLQSTQVLGK